MSDSQKNVVTIRNFLVLTLDKAMIGWVDCNLVVRNRQGEFIGRVVDGKILSESGDVVYHLYEHLGN